MSAAAAGVWSLPAASGARKLALPAWLLAILCLFLLATSDRCPARAYSDGQEAALKASQGRAALLRGQYQDADRLLTGSLHSPSLPFATRIFALGNRGIARWRLHDLRAALDDFNAALKLAPAEVALYNNRGNVLLELKLYEEAAKDFDQAIALAPSYGAAYNNRGNARFLLGDYQASLADFTKAVDLLPRNAVTFNGRGKAQLALKRPAGAMRDFSRAIVLNARYGQAYANRAAAMVALRRYKDAVDDYTSALQFGIDTANVYLGRAAVYARLNKPNQSGKDMAQAREHGPSLANASADPQSRQDHEAEPDKAETVSAPVPATLVCADKPNTAQIAPRFRASRVADASHLSLPNALLYRTKGEREDLAGQAGFVSAVERTALACDPASRQALLPASSNEDDDDERFVGPEVEDWTVEFTSKGDYVAQHLQYTTIKLTLEMYGTGEPELLHWQRLKGSLRRIGLLHYYAGVSPTGESLEYIALIDLYSGRLIAIEPCRWGERQAKWTWGGVAVVVVDPQGVSSRVQVRERPAYKALAPAKRAKAKRAKRSFQHRKWSPRRKRARFGPYARRRVPWSYR